LALATALHTGGESAKRPAAGSEALAIEPNYVLDAYSDKNSFGGSSLPPQRPDHCSATELKSLPLTGGERHAPQAAPILEKRLARGGLSRKRVKRSPRPAQPPGNVICRAEPLPPQGGHRTRMAEEPRFWPMLLHQEMPSAPTSSTGHSVMDRGPGPSRCVRDWGSSGAHGGVLFACRKLGSPDRPLPTSAPGWWVIVLGQIPSPRRTRLL